MHCIKHVGLLLLIAYTLVRADALIPIYMLDRFVSACSIEKTFCFERATNEKIALFPWVGLGILWPFYHMEAGIPGFPAGGIEAALEGRWYLGKPDHSGIFIGLYGGGSFMFPSYMLVGSSVGIKLGYKSVRIIRSKSRFAVEPYLSVSTSPVALWIMKGTFTTYFHGSILTFGVRFTHEWGKGLI